MRLEEANRRLNRLTGIPFGELFSDEDISDIIRNKGKTGQLLELALGLRLTSNNLDFDDGELKTNKCDEYGNPRETVFITQISSIIDDLLEGVPFERTHLFEKIINILYVPVCKDGDPWDWFFLPSTHIDLGKRSFAQLYDIWEDDYYDICDDIRQQVEIGDGLIHTANGRHRHLQIRSKDSKSAMGYHPIYSEMLGRYVSNKNYAFYFRKEFVNYIRELW